MFYTVHVTSSAVLRCNYAYHSLVHSWQHIGVASESHAPWAYRTQLSQTALNASQPSFQSLTAAAEAPVPPAVAGSCCYRWSNLKPSNSCKVQVRSDVSVCAPPPLIFARLRAGAARQQQQRQRRPQCQYHSLIALATCMTPCVFQILDQRLAHNKQRSTHAYRASI